MPLSVGRSLAIIAVTALTTFATRSFPFLVFSGKKVPRIVTYLGKALPPAVISMLVIYCLRNASLTAYPHAAPEMIAIAVTVALHVWKRNNLLSIGVGTVLYMFLIQTVF